MRIFIRKILLEKAYLLNAIFIILLIRKNLIRSTFSAQLELLVERVLGEKSTLASFDVLKQELHSLFKSERSNVALNVSFFKTKFFFKR